ncbi:MAG: hypothetical protein IJ172_00795, partial [Ruminococcus sp.]|nr:hypothetical protein [Ruminococcus sp.]
MNNTFEELFSQFEVEMPAALAGGKILKIITGRDNSDLCIVAAFERYVKYDEIEQFCAFMKKALGAQIFEIKCKYTPDMLSAEYFTEIFRFFKDRFPLVNGFFNG